MPQTLFLDLPEELFVFPACGCRLVVFLLFAIHPQPMRYLTCLPDGRCPSDKIQFLAGQAVMFSKFMVNVRFFVEKSMQRLPILKY
jgi:hypothetical protein